MTRIQFNHFSIVVFLLFQFTTNSNIKTEITDVSGFLPGYIAVFSCPSENTFAAKEPDGIIYTLRVDMYLSDKDNLPSIISGSTNDKTKISIKIKKSKFEVKLSKSKFGSLFGNTIKKDCTYNWKNLENISFKKESIVTSDVFSQDLDNEYEEDDEDDVNNSKVQFGENGKDETFNVDNVNLLQVAGGYGAATREGYKLYMRTIYSTKPFDAVMEDQEYLKMLFEGDGSGHTVWYWEWWVWVLGGGVVLLVVCGVYMMCVKNTENSYESK